MFEPEKCYLFNTDESVESKSIYYKAILQNLFFASLNAEQGKRAFRIDGQNQNATSLMRYKRYHKNPEDFVKLIESKVPFMNGGLFECLDHQDDVLKGKNGGALINYEDGFSDRKDNELFVPDYVFFGKDVKVDLSSEYDDKRKKDVTVNGIINILQKYKFTIAENTLAEGYYSLKLSGSQSIEFENAVTVADSSSGNIEFSFEAPDPVGRHMQHTLYLTVKNTAHRLFVGAHFYFHALPISRRRRAMLLFSRRDMYD